MSIKEKLLTTTFKREKGCLYYLKSNDEGYLEIWVSDRRKNKKEQSQNKSKQDALAEIRNEDEQLLNGIPE